MANKTAEPATAVRAKERRLTAGGRALREHIDSIPMSVPDWCEKHRMERIPIQRVLNGEQWKRISVEMAFAIEDATDGKVQARLFVSDTAKRVPKPARGHKAAA